MDGTMGAPVVIERREGHFTGCKGDELFFQTWTQPLAHATLVITHGIGEHSESYAKTAEHLVPMGWNICAWDLRGHGRSEGKRGYVEDFRNYSDDLGRFLSFLRDSGRLSEPYALVGHSMGGLVTLRYVVDSINTLDAAALALSSPLLGVALPVPPVKDFFARIMNRVMPTLTLFNEIRYEDLTRDPEWIKSYPLDVLRHDKISPSLYLGMFENIEYVKALAHKITLPTLMLAAGKEKIVSRPAIEEFFKSIGAENKKIVIYEDSYHEIFNDLDRETVFRDLDAFLSPLLKGSPKGKK